MRDFMEALVLTNPLPKHNKSASISLKKFISILPKRFKNIHLISSNYDEICFDECNKSMIVSNFKRYYGKNSIIKILNIINIQFKACITIKRCNSKMAFFWISDKMILPFIFCKLKNIDRYNFVLFDIAYMCNLKGIKNKLSVFLMTYMAEHAEYVCVESIHVLDSWPALLKKKNIKVIHLYADSDIFEYRVPYKKRKKVIGMLTRLANEKNVISAVNAFHKFNTENNGEWKFMIIGDGPLRTELSEIINTLGASVELCGWRERNEVSMLLNEFKLLLMPTSSEGLPNALLEAMWCGTPALATRVGGIKDLVIDCNTGWYLDGVLSEEILEGLRRLPNDNEMEKISLNAASFVREKFSYEKSYINAENELALCSDKI